MHITDGILSPSVCLATGALAAGAVGVSLRKLNSSLSVRSVPLTGMMAALVFSGQMVNFPIGVPVSGHLLGGLLAAIVVGPWGGCVTLALVLFVQMALFSDGGWMSYGANVLNMGVVGSLGGYAVYAAIRHWLGGTRGILVGAVVAAWISVLGGSSLFCLEFALSHPHQNLDLARIFVMMTSFHSLIGIGEALITAMVLNVVVMQRPDLIYTPESPPGLIAGTGQFVWVGVVVALAVAAFLAPFASEYADGLEAVAARMNFDSLEQPAKPLLLAEYEVPLPGVDTSAGFWHKVSVSLAGLLGTGSVFVMALVFGRALKSHGPVTEASHGA